MLQEKPTSTMEEDNPTSDRGSKAQGDGNTTLYNGAPGGAGGKNHDTMSGGDTGSGDEDFDDDAGGPGSAMGINPGRLLDLSKMLD